MRDSPESVQAYLVGIAGSLLTRHRRKVCQPAAAGIVPVLWRRGLPAVDDISLHGAFDVLDVVAMAETEHGGWRSASVNEAGTTHPQAPVSEVGLSNDFRLDPNPGLERGGDV